MAFYGTTFVKTAGESYQSPMLDHAKMKILRIIAQRMTEIF